MKVLLFWSAGKDSAWALYKLRREGYSVAALLTITTPSREVPGHQVPISLVRRQAVAAGLPLWEVPIPPFLSAELRDRLVIGALTQAKHQGFTAVAFGDIHLRSCRAYKEALARQVGLEPLFPLWVEERYHSFALVQEMTTSGLKAVVVAAETNKIPSFRRGMNFSLEWVKSLPPSVDPYGEYGEYHTFCYAGPMFSEEIPLVGVS